MSNSDQEIQLGVSDFVALLNQSMEFAFSGVIITGELANLRVSKNRWVYFDLKDEFSTVKFFGTVYQLPGPLEDGMLLKVRGTPKLHNLYGFSVNVSSIQPAGEGTIKRAAQLLEAKLAKEGLFDPGRKRSLPYPPRRIGLVTSKQSAAYADFMKILNARWQGVEILFVDVQVQGEAAPRQITSALEQINEVAEPPEALVVIRGGGSAEDLAAFSSEQVTRAIAGSRVPTLVAIGHEIDTCLAELAADRRASTPSNAAELLVPDRQQLLQRLPEYIRRMERGVRFSLQSARREVQDSTQAIHDYARHLLGSHRETLARHTQLLTALSPDAILQRGYAIVRLDSKVVRGIRSLTANDIVEVQLADGRLNARIDVINRKQGNSKP